MYAYAVGVDSVTRTYYSMCRVAVEPIPAPPNIRASLWWWIRRADENFGRYPITCFAINWCAA